MIFRSSFVGEAKRCVALAYYRYYLGLSTKDATQNIDLFFGKELHNAIQISFEQSLEAGLEHLDQLLWPPSKTKTKITAMNLLRQLHYKFDYNVVACEQDFSFPLDNDEWFGRYDMIAEKYDERYVLEFKTTNPYYLLIKPNDQFITYYIGARQDFNINGMLVVSLDPSEVEVTFVPVKFSQEDINEWTREFSIWKEYFKRCVVSGVLPKNPTSCFDYNRKCEFFELCLSNKRMRDNIMNNRFIVDENLKEMRW